MDKNLFHPRIKLSNSNWQLSILETEVLLLRFAQQFRRKNADILDIYYTLLDAAGISLTLVLNQNAKAKERKSWVRFQKMNVRSCKGCTRGEVLLMGRYAI